MGVLGWITLLPLFGAGLVMLVPREEEAIHRGLGLLTAIVTFVVSLLILPDFDAAKTGFQLEVDKVWIAPLGIRFHLGIDGISLWLVLLTTFLMPVTLLSPQAIGIRNIRVREFIIAMLLLEAGLIGAFLALDLFVFYVFWELMLIPMYFIIGIWGGERRLYASIKFVIYTLIGSLLMLVAILFLYVQYHAATGSYSFDYVSLSHLTLPYTPQMLCFGAFALAFAIKVPVFPLHTWLPDAHVEAPTGGSVILAGILLKLGTYGFLRFAMPLFPQASRAAQPLLVALAVIGILYGALVAWVQPDMKKLVAYSSIAHLGFVMLGLLAVDLYAWQGALLQMLNHGLSTGALFLLVGMIYDRRHTKKFDEFGGLAKVMPIFAFFLVFSALASVGLPALNGFVGEFMILVGSYRALGWPAALATFGVVLAAVYLLKMLQLALWGPITKDANRNLKDLSLREVVAVLPLCVLMLWIGVAPNTFLAPSQKALESVMTAYQARLAGPEVREARLQPVRPLEGLAASAVAPVKTAQAVEGAR
ncbi:MAG TPA: NADH-quinone oxidoreductase subunit M [Thermoanaerobaculia bacterium]